MPIRQIFDASDKILSAACLKWYLKYSHFNFSPCEELVVGDDEGSRFFCPKLTTNSIMVKSTTPPPTPQKVEVSYEEFQFLDIYFNKRDAANVARHLRSVCIDALGNPDSNRDNVAYILQLAESVLELQNP